MVKGYTKRQAWIAGHSEHLGCLLNLLSGGASVFVAYRIVLLIPESQLPRDGCSFWMVAIWLILPLAAFINSMIWVGLNVVGSTIIGPLPDELDERAERFDLDSEPNAEEPEVLEENEHIINRVCKQLLIQSGHDPYHDGLYSLQLARTQLHQVRHPHYQEEMEMTLDQLDRLPPSTAMRIVFLDEPETMRADPDAWQLKSASEVGREILETIAMLLQDMD